MDFLIRPIFGSLRCQRSEIICRLAELLTEKSEEILTANKTDMDLAVHAGNRGTHSLARKNQMLFYVIII